MGWLSNLFCRPLQISDHVATIVRLMDEKPDEWKLAEFCADHLKSDIRVWIANQEYGCCIYKPIEIKLPAHERKALWDAATRLLTHQVESLLQGNLNDHLHQLQALQSAQRPLARDHGWTHA